ncbi:hypothetical protein OHB05_43120 [Streptomyces sp. NBC_00638]|uniref:hypothetical protein n=1 Tax=unclassified Streptomyces TaxID=2593676 RepID=UPI00224EB6B4|nr:hypothetical protein [Streptomyces sp. NBC_00638]MCX5009306.1 hypothetical protein [Streptomyces sp. NBC_00638]
MPITDSRVRTPQLTRPRSAEPQQAPVHGSAASPPSTAALPLECFFPGCFEILLPAITTAVPQIFAAFRSENESRATELARSGKAMDRSLAELVSLVGPLLSEVLPVLIEMIHDAGGAEGLDDEALERFLPDLLGALVPVLVNALPSALQSVGGLLGGLFGTGRDSAAALPRVVDTEVSSRFLGPLLQAFLPAVAAGLPRLVALITGQGAPASRDTAVTWQDFTKITRFWDNDIISLSSEPIDDPNTVEVAILIPDHMTWWKGVQIQDDNGGFVAEIGVQDGHKYDVVRVDARLLLEPNGYLVFKKAKAFGIHTGMYRLATGGLDQLRGRRTTFHWSAC